MKNLLVVLSIFLFYSCSKSDNENNQQAEKTIEGSWKLIEIFGYYGINDPVWKNEGLDGEVGDGGDPRWYVVTNGYTYTFKSNGVFTTNRVSCNGGYTLDGEFLVQINNCGDANISRLLFYIIDEDGFLNMSPEPNFCIDSCGAKFIRVAE